MARPQTAFSEPTLRLRLAHYRAAVAAAPCSACGAEAGVPCRLNYVERMARDTLHLARHLAWMVPQLQA